MKPCKVKRLFNALLISITLTALLSGCAQSQAATAKFQVPAKEASWGMSLQDVKKLAGDSAKISEKKADDGIVETVVSSKPVETDFGTSVKTTYQVETESPGDNSNSALGLYQVTFEFDNMNRAELEKKLIAKYGKMTGSTKSWQTESNQEVPVEYYTPSDASTESLSNEQKNELQNYYQKKIDEARAQKSLKAAGSVKDVMKNPVFRMIVYGDSKSQGCSLSVSAYFLAVLSHMS